MRVPWKQVASWHCNACGKCCREYTVRLTFYEYLLLRKTGFVEEKATGYYIKKIGKSCPFQHRNLCLLHGKIKPKACRLFPFVILKKGEEDARYEFKGEEFYVYLELGCPNIKIGMRNSPFSRGGDKSLSWFAVHACSSTSAAT